MSHHIYHTEGIVLSGYNTGEANKYVAVFTRELGLVRATVQSIRKSTSKLRYSLQNYSFAKVDFVRGRDVWRITNAIPLTLFDNVLKDSTKVKLVARIVMLIERLCHGEEQNVILFDEVLSGFKKLEKIEMNNEELLDFETMLVAKILFHLGYWKGEKGIENIVNDVLINRKEIICKINEALKESHL